MSCSWNAMQRSDLVADDLVLTTEVRLPGEGAPEKLSRLENRYLVSLEADLVPALPVGHRTPACNASAQRQQT